MTISRFETHAINYQLNWLLSEMSISHVYIALSYIFDRNGTKETGLYSLF